MDDTPTVQISLTIPRVCCPLHRQAFHSQWPDGYMTFAHTALHVVMSDALFAASVQGKVESVDKALDKLPLCCRLSNDELVKILSSNVRLNYLTCETCREYVQCFKWSRPKYPRGVKVVHRAICVKCFCKFVVR